jgi:hypothetical protein
MSRNFYYGKDANVVAGSANFASQISSSAASFGLTPAQATAFGLLNDALQSAYTQSKDPSTRTPMAIAGKNSAIRAMRTSAVLLSRIVYATATVTDAQLVGLGLSPRATRQPIPVPATPPVVETVSVVGRLVTVRLHGADTERRGKPFGAVAANVYSYVGAAPPADPRDYHFEGTATRTITQIQFPNTVAGGATVWLSACWVSARGQTSPASAPLGVTIQGGGTLPMAA